jgi:hypothetical protein
MKNDRKWRTSARSLKKRSGVGDWVASSASL